MYERRLRELARTAEADEPVDEDHARSKSRPAADREDLAVA